MHPVVARNKLADVDHIAKASVETRERTIPEGKAAMRRYFARGYIFIVVPDNFRTPNQIEPLLSFLTFVKAVRTRLV